MRRLWILSLGVAALVASGGAHAEKYKCACKSDQKAAVESISNMNLECVSSEIFDDYKHDVSVQEEYLKIQVDDDQLVLGASNDHVDFQWRPRNGYCVGAIRDVSNDTGASTTSISGNCDAGKWATFKDLALHQMDSTATVDWRARFEISPTITSKSSRSYDGMIYFVQGSDGKRNNAAVCLQNY